jgi:bile acid:Na+ symporter, BASS family
LGKIAKYLSWGTSIMNIYHSLVARASRFMRDYLLWLLLSVYLLAAFLPAQVVWGREVCFGELRLLGETSRITLSIALLALLLFNAGLDIPLAQLRKQVREPGLVVAGLTANLLIPIGYIIGIGYLLHSWPDQVMVQNVILGLALIASMPIAGSSAAWAQNTNSNLALSLGLILASTLLSPLTTPMMLRSVSWLVDGDHLDGLLALAGSGMSIFLAAFVLVPSLLGVGVRRLVGDRLIGKVLPTVKLLSTVTLLLLTYTNASVSLPGMVAEPDWVFLVLALGAALGMCVLAFTAGWVLANLMGAEDDQRTALMFGLGLNISSPGLVMASVALAHLPAVMLPTLLYTLVQHVVAGVVCQRSKRQAAASVPTPVPVPQPALWAERACPQAALAPVRMPS